MQIKTKISLFFLLAVLAIAGFFRFWHLDKIPPGLYPDVAVNGTDAIGALETSSFQPFYPANNGREGLFMNLIALSFGVFGISVWSLKFVAALFGFFTVLGTYLLTKQLFFYIAFEKKSYEFIALVSSFFLAISFWHVNFSRLGFRAIMVPFFLVWCFYFLFKGVANMAQNQNDTLLPAPPKKKKTALFFALSGFLFGMGFHTYIAFRIAPIILVPVFLISIVAYWPKFKSDFKNRESLISLFKKSYIKNSWINWDIFAVAMIIAILPLAMYFYKNPADFMGRTGQVSIFASENPIKQLVLSAIKTFGQFVVWGDSNWRHNIPGSPEIFWPLIPLFLLGLIYSILQIFRQKNYSLEKLPILSVFYTLLVWWGAMLMPSIMTNEGLPHSLRTIGAIPPSFIFIGLGAFILIKFLQKSIVNRQALLAIYGLLILSIPILIGIEYYRYFIYWGQNEETQGAFTQLFVNEGNYLNSLPQNIKKYILTNEGGVPVPYPYGPPVSAQTIKFITYNKSDINFLRPEEFPDFLNKNIQSPAIFLPMAYSEFIFSQLQQKFPNGKTEQINDFWVFKTQ